MMLKVALLFAVVAVATANDILFRTCPGLPAPTRVWSEHCTPTLCTLRRNQIFAARAYFSPLESFNVLSVTVAASVFGINFPMSVPTGYDNACLHLGNGASCPVHFGEDHVWEIQMPVDPIYPLVSNLVIRRKFLNNLCYLTDTVLILPFFLLDSLQSPQSKVEELQHVLK